MHALANRVRGHTHVGGAFTTQDDDRIAIALIDDKCQHKHGDQSIHRSNMRGTLSCRDHAFNVSRVCDAPSARYREECGNPFAAIAQSTPPPRQIMSGFRCTASCASCCNWPLAARHQVISAQPFIGEPGVHRSAREWWSRQWRRLPI